MAWKVNLLRACGRFAGSLVQRVGQLRATHVEQRVECRRRGCAALDRVVDASGDARLVAARPGRKLDRAGIEHEIHVVGVVGQRRPRGREAAGRGDAIEGADQSAGRGQDRVGPQAEAAGQGDGLHDGAGQGRGAGDIGAAGRRRRDCDRVSGAAVEGQVAADGERAGGVARRQRSTRIDRGVADGAGAAERAAAVDDHPARRRDVAVHGERAAIDRRRPGIGVDARQRQRAGAGLHQRAAGAAAPGAAIGDHAAHDGRLVVAADRQLVGAEVVIASTGDRAGADLVVAVRAGRAGEIDRAAGIIDDRSIAGGAGVIEIQGGIVVDGRAACRAGVIEYHVVVVDDGRAARRAAEVE